MSAIGMLVAQQILPGLVRKLTKGKGKVVEQIADIALDITGLDKNASPEAVMDQLSKNPEAFARVKEAAAEVTIAEIEAEIEDKRIAMEDRLSAREMAVSNGDNTTRNLAYMAAGFALASLAGVLAIAFLGFDVAPAMLTLIGSAVGYGFSYFQQVMNFHFGSSAGSKKKTQMLGE